MRNKYDVYGSIAFLIGFIVLMFVDKNYAWAWIGGFGVASAIRNIWEYFNEKKREKNYVY